MIRILAWSRATNGVRAVPVCLTLALAVTIASGARCQEPATDAAAQPKPALPAPLQPDASWLRVAKTGQVWLDLKKKQVIVGGQICLRAGMLEMFACPKGTKEHESIVSVNAPARFVHGALLALGAEPGPPVQFDPVYRPAQGTEVRVEVLWRDTHGEEHRVNAQEWVKNVKSGEAMTYPWVFAGSGFWTDQDGKERFYYADGGEFVCVSNFSTAMLDLPVESSAANDDLMFCAFTDRIPPLGTPVMLLLTPQLEKPKDGAPQVAPGDPDAGKAEPEPEPKPETPKQETEAAPKKAAPQPEAETGETHKAETREAHKPETGDAHKAETREAHKAETGETHEAKTGEARKREAETPAAEPGSAG